MFQVGPPAVVWTIVAVAAAVVEISIPHFGVIFASLGALAAAGMAGVGAGFTLQLLTFVIVAGVSLAILRPRLMTGTGARGVPSRTDTLLGREGIVTDHINPLVGTGRVNVGGEDWAAHSPGPLTVGTHVRIVSANGIVLEVTPV
jgi:membrane protein implicated in regulation of membrane protease activity